MVRKHRAPKGALRRVDENLRQRNSIKSESTERLKVHLDRLRCVGHLVLVVDESESSERQKVH